MKRKILVTLSKKEDGTGHGGTLLVGQQEPRLERKLVANRGREERRAAIPRRTAKGI